MNSVARIYKKLKSPVTVMFIPHNSRRSFGLSVPMFLIALAVVGMLCGGGLLYKISRDAARYYPTKRELDYYQSQLQDIQSTIASLKTADTEFKRLFALNTKEDVLESMNDTHAGALDMDVLRRQINKTIDNVGEIRDYLSSQRDLYRSTPMGWPAKGWISSGYGRRTHPIRGGRDFHTGIDISAKPSSPVHATADGIVSFSGRSGANGNLVAIEHGSGYSTYYAHNKKILVSVGQVVKRGEVIALVGSTGSSTGPHVHYEVWKEGKNINPRKYLKGGDW